MKKKIITIVAALVCVLTCVFGLAACDDGESGKVFFGITDGVNNDISSSSGYYNIDTVYGRKPDLNQYKLYLYDSQGKIKEEVSKSDSKLSTTYYYIAPNATEDQKQNLTALPSEYLVGTYQIEYVYDGKSDLKTGVYIGVALAENGDFKVRPAKTAWYYNEKLPDVTLLNPKSKPVTKLTSYDEADVAKDDTNVRDGELFYYYAVVKSVYDSIPADKKLDYQYMCDDVLHGDKQGTDWQYYEAGFEGQLQAGEYMLLAVVSRTYNYRNIVTPAVSVTVKDHFVERTFTFQSMVLQDNEGNTLTDTENEYYGEYVSMAASMDTANAETDLICKTNREVRGTVDFGSGALDGLTGEETLYYFVNGNDIDICSNAAVGEDGSISGTNFGHGVLTGNTLTLTVSIDGIYNFVVTFIGQ